MFARRLPLSRTRRFHARTQLPQARFLKVWRGRGDFWMRRNEHTSGNVGEVYAIFCTHPNRVGASGWPSIWLARLSRTGCICTTVTPNTRTLSAPPPKSARLMAAFTAAIFCLCRNRFLNNKLNLTTSIAPDLYPLKQVGQSDPHHEFPLRNGIEKTFRVITNRGENHCSPRASLHDQADALCHGFPRLRPKCRSVQPHHRLF